MTILITGSTGFIGSALAQTLANASVSLHLASRRKNFVALPNSKVFYLEDINAHTDWENALEGVETVIHAAGIAHRGGVTAKEYVRTNVEGTGHLAAMSVAAGVKHFIFLSSVGVHGRVSRGCALTEASPYDPYNNYSLSKLIAEEAILAISKNSSMAITIIRPPLVYAAHAPGNFGRLLRLVAQGIPLPLGALENRRSVIALENLIDFILACLTKEQAQNQNFLIADPQPVSTQSILRWLAQGMKKRERLLQVPPRMVFRIAQLLGQEERYQQLCGDLELSTEKAQGLLGWEASLTTHTAIVKAGEVFMGRRNNPANKI